jgi:hypothetical protein
MSNPEYQATFNWDDMALVRPISAPINWDDMALVRPISAPVNWDDMALVRPISAPVNWDDLALVRPISPTSNPVIAAGESFELGSAGSLFGAKLTFVEGQGFVIDKAGAAPEGVENTEGAIPTDSPLIQNLLARLGSRDLSSFVVEKSGAIGLDAGIASIDDLASGPYHIVGVEGLDMSGAYGTILLSGPDGNWEITILQQAAFERGEVSITATEHGADHPEAYVNDPAGIESAIIPVGFNGLEFALL